MQNARPRLASSTKARPYSQLYMLTACAKAAESSQLASSKADEPAKL